MNNTSQCNISSMSEFVVLEGSPFIGMELVDLVKEYSVKILHYHNPLLVLDTKTPYNPLSKIRDNFLIKVEGTRENIASLRLDSVRYE